MPMPSELGERADVNFDENQVSISEIGAELARDFGMSLHGKYDAIFHSPVLRCKQTAEKISASSGIPIAGELKFLSSEFFDQLIAANESLKKDVISEMLSNSGAGYDRNDLFKKCTSCFAGSRTSTGSREKFCMLRMIGGYLSSFHFTPIFSIRLVMTYGPIFSRGLASVIATVRSYTVT